MTDLDAEPRHAGEGHSRRRAMTGFWATLSPAQQAAALAYRGPENHGDPAFAMEGRRRLRVNDNLDVRRRGGHIVVMAGPVQLEITPEEARRAADALLSFAAANDAVDVEIEEVGMAA